jgi:hypothetical protein
MLTTQQLHTFAEAGYLLLAGLVSAQDLDRADAEVSRLLTGAPPPAGQVGPYFYWRSPAQSPVFVHRLAARLPQDWTQRPLLPERRPVGFGTIAARQSGASGGPRVQDG